MSVLYRLLTFISIKIDCALAFSSLCFVCDLIAINILENDASIIFFNDQRNVNIVYNNCQILFFYFSLQTADFINCKQMLKFVIVNMLTKEGNEVYMANRAQTWKDSKEFPPSLTINYFWASKADLTSYLSSKFALCHVPRVLYVYGWRSSKALVDTCSQDLLCAINWHRISVFHSRLMVKETIRKIREVKKTKTWHG